MTLEMLNIQAAWPEIFLLGMACIVLIVDVYLDQQKRYFTYLLSQATLLIAALLTTASVCVERMTAFNGMFVHDPMGAVLKTFILVIVFFVFAYSKDYLKDRNIFKGEFYVLGLFGALGMMIMVSAHSLLTLYLGLELLSLSLYAMVAINRDSSVATEAAMKYFVLGAIASGMLLYGMSMVYGVSGTLDIGVLASTLAQQESMHIGLVFGLVFIIVGLAFKLGAVPFHMWIPDVYQGSPTSVTSYIASAPKIAGFAMVMRLLVEGMGALHTDWQSMLIILAVLSMATGNIIAIAQTNLKRMLAYSTISHVGFLLLGILSGNPEGYSSAMFYVLVYSLMSLGAFGMIILLARAGFEAENINDFKGLNQRSPWFAFMMLILMFSMAGVPPTVGFWAKFAVLSAVVSIDMVWLAVVAVFFSIIGIYYYLRVVKVMYFDKAEDEVPLSNAMDMRVLLSVNGLAILGLGLFPGALMGLCAAAFSL